VIKRIRIRNFRCFKDHEVSFNRSAILVGRNNAGKSTVVEALRLVSLIEDRYKTSAYHDPPHWTGLPKPDRGICPALQGLDFTDVAVFHRYEDPPAVIEALFSNGNKVEAHIRGGSELHAVVRGPFNRAVTRRGEAKEVAIPTVSILPPVAPVRLVESVLTEEHVKQQMSSHLSPLHFRNQLRYGKKYFRRFKDLCESMWPRLQVKEIVESGTTNEPTLSLLIRDDDFTAEIGRMGHGLQIWMQIMWYLARSRGTSTIILDEPDVYLHADLQRKLIRALRGRFKQVLLATHSVEIMAEVSPEDVLVIERNAKRSKHATDIASVQRVVDNIGGAHNLQLARLGSAKKTLLVEGKDLRILSLFHDSIRPDSLVSMGATPNFAVGGWGGWKEAVGAAKSMKNALGQRVDVYCIFDRDYHDDEECSDRYDRAQQAGIRLHIWRRKEIENYLLVAAAIARSISKRSDSQVDTEEVLRQMESICDGLRSETVGAVADAYQQRNRSKAPSTALKHAEQVVARSWSTFSDKVCVVGGKRVLALMSQWAQMEFSVILSPTNIVRHMRNDEVPGEMRFVVGSIDERLRLESDWDPSRSFD
jgi:predicted ATPase